MCLIARRCRNVVLKSNKHHSYAWCDDFLSTGGALGTAGSCCKADGEIFYGWCQQVCIAAAWVRATNMHCHRRCFRCPCFLLACLPARPPACLAC